MVEGVTQAVLDDAARDWARQPILGLALELRLPDEQRKHGGGGAEDIFRGDLARAFVAGKLPIGAQAPDEPSAQACLVGAAVWRRDRVAIRAQETIGGRDPGDGPFERAVPFRLLDPACEHILGDGLLALDAACEEILEPAGEVEHRTLRRLAVAAKQRLRARPADLDAAKEIGLRARHAEQTRRRKCGIFTENLGIWPETDARAAAVLDRSEVLKRTIGNATRVGLAVELLPASNLDLHADR